MGLGKKIKIGEKISVLLEKLKIRMEKSWFQQVKLKKLKGGMN